MLPEISQKKMPIRRSVFPHTSPKANDGPQFCKIRPCCFRRVKETQKMRQLVSGRQVWGVKKKEKKTFQRSKFAKPGLKYECFIRFFVPRWIYIYIHICRNILNLSKIISLVVHVVPVMKKIIVTSFFHVWLDAELDGKQNKCSVTTF